MAKNLRHGASIIRFLQLLGLVFSICGAIYAGKVLYFATTLEETAFVWFALVTFSLVAAMLLVVIWMLAARNLTKRVNILDAALDKAAGGDLTVRVVVHSADELDHLGATFNLMLERLEHLVVTICRILGALQGVSARNREAAEQVLNTAELQATEVATTSTAVVAIESSVATVNQGVEDLARSAMATMRAIQEMTASIDEVRDNVTVQTGAIDEVSSAITQMSVVVGQISDNVNSLMQAAATTTSSIAEMDAVTKQVEKSARETAAISGEVRTDAERGQAAVEATITGINAIRASSRSTQASITTLSERVAAIDRILSVIDEIAEQTNLLALNSAIIAAQAGEHGKGFAIVAGEIKGLANRTRQSTMEIAELINGVQEETDKAVSAIRSTEERVAEGEHLSHRAGEALAKIVAGVQMATGQVNEIARAGLEQTRGSQSIHAAMQHVADMVAQIARSCDEQAATSSSIMQAVERMKEFTRRVTTSTGNQQHVGSMIGTATREMTEIVQLIRKACGEQSTWSSQIVRSVNGVQKSADTNLSASRLMEAGVESLSTQIELLQHEVAKLQVSREREY
jgi:methyl-accepting chemotaxis protein